MANNELSGLLVAANLYRELKKKKSLRYSYRFLFLPETIGSIAYLSKFGDELKKKVDAGFVVTCVGDDKNITYKKSRIGNCLADRAVLNVLENSRKSFKVLDWLPVDGSDDRQYCSPGFNLPVGSLMRTKYGDYPQYHTSLDNKDFISENGLKGSIELYLEVLETIELNRFYTNTNPFCEPCFSKRGLTMGLGGQKISNGTFNNYKYILNYSDGHHDLIEIANKARGKAIDFKEDLMRLIETGLII